jgi:AcrR family transcriptional regulator
MEETVDPRVKKTRVLLQLISEKGFDAITVKDLTQYAEINRATFYQHYYDKFDLLDQNIENMLLNLVITVGPKNRDELIGHGEEPSLVYVRLFKFISENAAFFKIMMGKNGIPSFQTRMLKMNGIELTRQLKEKKANLQVCVLTCHSEFHYAQ